METGEITAPAGIWAKLHAAMEKIKAFFKEKYKTMGLMVVVALLLDIITGIPGGILGAMMVIH